MRFARAKYLDGYAVIRQRTLVPEGYEETEGSFEVFATRAEASRRANVINMESDEGGRRIVRRIRIEVLPFKQQGRFS